MKKLISISLLTFLFLAAASRCFGMMSIAFVSKERAKELGIELRVKASGTNDVWVELEFKPQGELKQFDHVSLEIREGDKFLMGYTPLKEKRSKTGNVSVQFMANRAFLDKVTLSIVVGEPMNYAGYELRVKDFVEPVVKSKRVSNDRLGEDMKSREEVSYYDRNGDGKADEEKHHYRGTADADWELLDDNYDGRYEKKILYGLRLWNQRLIFRCRKTFTSSRSPGHH